MTEVTAVQIALFAAMIVVGALLGWVLRGGRSKHEKTAINAGWQGQLEAQRTEHERLTSQNKSLMEQVSQLQASNNDAKNRAKELSVAVREALQRRDRLQREIKDIRGNLETAMSEKNRLQSDIEARAGDDDALEARDKRIAKLETELETWRNRLPPLIERFQDKSAEADRLKADLEAARARIRELQADFAHSQTYIEPVNDPGELTDGQDASNDTLEEELKPPSDYDLLNGRRDSLQSIKGVGPAIEKTLNELGIFRFEQIANMSEYDIDRVANRLKGFRSRIYREDWIGQARELRDRQDS